MMDLEWLNQQGAHRMYDLNKAIKDKPQDCKFGGAEETVVQSAEKHLIELFARMGLILKPNPRFKV